MTSVAVLGSGRVAQTLANKLAQAGHDITVGTRRTTVDWAHPPTVVTDDATAAQTADVVINATPGDGSVQRLAVIEKALRGKVLIDVANATVRAADGRPAGLLYPGSSLAEHLQQALPDTGVVKTLNTMLFTVMADPYSLCTPATVFVSGNDSQAKMIVTALLVDLGWPPGWIEDLGDISTACATEAMMLMVPAIVRNHGLQPFAFTIAKASD